MLVRSLPVLTLSSLMCLGALPHGASADGAALRADCPSPAPLYALRTKKRAEFIRMLGLRRVPPIEPNAEGDDTGYSNRRWEVELQHVWAPLPTGRCHLAVVRADMKREWRTEDGSGDEVLESVLATYQVGADGKLVRGADLASAEDVLTLGDPAIGDVTGDGQPDHIAIEEIGVTGGACYGMIGDECYCTTPRPAHLRLDKLELHVGGALMTDEQKAVAAVTNEYLQVGKCPEPQPRYRRWDLRGQPALRRTADVLEVSFLAHERHCRGWQVNGKPDDVSMCRKPQLIRVQHTVKDGKVQTTTSPAQVTQLLADDATAALVAVPWNLSDGNPTPHRVDVQLGRSEGGRARQKATRGKALSLLPGVYLVQVGDYTRTYQVTVTPGQETIHIADAM